MAWLSSNSLSPTDSLHADQLNSLANDIRNWGGDVNGGGHHLSNVIIDGYTPPGGGVALNSPAQVIPAAGDPSSQVWLDSTNQGTGVSTPRWAFAKDGTSETGANAGSDFAIVRYSDTGIPLTTGTPATSTPFKIRRSDGLVTIGAQQWAGPINGGGQTISNVVISGVLTDPTTTKGDLIVHGTAIARLPVGADTQVLTADSTQALGVKWAAPLVSSVFGRTGAVVLTGADITGAGGVLATRKIIAGAGLSGGGDLSADRTLTAVPLGASGAGHAAGIVPDPGATLGATRFLREDATWAVPAGGTGGGLSDPTTTLGDLMVRGAAAVTRLGVGANGQVLTADSTQTLGVKWAAVAAGSPQTPWAQNVNAAGFNLSNTGGVIVGGSAALVGGVTVTLAGNTLSGTMFVNGAFAQDATSIRGVYFGYDTSAQIGVMAASTAGAASQLAFWTFSGAAWAERVRISGAGMVGIGITAPTDYLYVQSPAGVRCAVTLTQPGYASAAIGSLASDGNLYITNALLAGFGTLANSIVLASNGNTGIGKAPAYKLDVAGDVNVTGAFRVNGAAIAAGGSGPTAQASAAPYFTTPTTARAFSGIYKNTGATAIYVTVSFFNATTGGMVSVFCDTNATPSTEIARAGSNTAVYGAVSFVVPPGFSYMLTQQTATPSLTAVIEWR